jgi:hypothetical protein
MEAIEFFTQSEGKWRSQRIIHHLAFRMSETGGSEIAVEYLSAEHPEIIELCRLHGVEPEFAIGGSRVQWQGSMDWDQESEAEHQGNTIFAVVPDSDNPCAGRLLRERGYAEIVPVVGRYHLDHDGGLVLTTEYETMSSVERFWFASPNVRMRTSIVKRFGGFSSASFCTETRIQDGDGASRSATASAPLPDPSLSLSQDALRTGTSSSIFGW